MHFFVEFVNGHACGSVVNGRSLPDVMMDGKGDYETNFGTSKDERRHYRIIMYDLLQIKKRVEFFPDLKGVAIFRFVFLKNY